MSECIQGQSASRIRVHPGSECIQGQGASRVRVHPGSGCIQDQVQSPVQIQRLNKELITSMVMVQAGLGPGCRIWNPESGSDPGSRVDQNQTHLGSGGSRVRNRSRVGHISVRVRFEVRVHPESVQGQDEVHQGQRWTPRSFEMAPGAEAQGRERLQGAARRGHSVCIGRFSRFGAS